jgi:hypothetical protein
MGKYASDDLWASYAAGKIHEQKAVAITKGAPGNTAAQRLAMDKVQSGRTGARRLKEAKRIRVQSN